MQGITQRCVELEVRSSGSGRRGFLYAWFLTAFFVEPDGHQGHQLYDP